MIYTDEKTQILKMKCWHWLILTFLVFFAGCTFPGGKQKTNRIRFTIQNTLAIDRENVPIVMTLDQLRKVSPDFSLNAYSVVTGKQPREAMIPAQADDLNYDGERDQLVFLLDLEREQTKEISILYDPNVKATFTLDVKKQTRAGIFPEMDAVAAVESDLIAYLLKPSGAVVAYGKKREELFGVDGMFQSELENDVPLSPEFRFHFESKNISLSQNPQAIKKEVKKPEQRWVIHDLENQEDYFVRKTEEQLNLFKSIGLSLNTLLDPENTTMVMLTPLDELIGCGGFALWHRGENELIPLPSDEDYVRILADGGMRSVVQRILPSWYIDGETYHLKSTTFIYGSNPWIEHQIQLDRELPADYAIVAGIPKLGETSGVDEDQGLLWSWGTDPDGTYPLGIALIHPTTQTSSLIDTDASRLSISLNPDSEGRISYRTFAIWEGGINGIETQSEFLQHLQIMITTMKNRPKIKFLPLEEGKK
ncbi:MAG: DUF4861 family protein [Candidatus Poribacteria bacterium]|nr:DUF4861 family protein [Candidatus Poribacteria bacterium]